MVGSILRRFLWVIASSPGSEKLVSRTLRKCILRQSVGECKQHVIKNKNCHIVATQDHSGSWLRLLPGRGYLPYSGWQAGPAVRGAVVLRDGFPVQGQAGHGRGSFGGGAGQLSSGSVLSADGVSDKHLALKEMDKTGGVRKKAKLID